MSLQNLTIEAQRPSESQLEEILGGLVSYDVSQHLLLLSPRAQQLSVKARILLILLASKGWEYLTPNDASDQLTTKEIQKLLDVPGGTVRPTLRRLRAERLIGQNGMKYFLSDLATSTMKREVDAKGGETK